MSYTQQRTLSGAAIGGGAGLLGGYAYDQVRKSRGGHEGICLRRRVTSWCTVFHPELRLPFPNLCGSLLFRTPGSRTPPTTVGYRRH